MATNKWQNWSGIVKCQPQKIKYPKSEKELQKVVQKCIKKGQRLRVCGTGHSWNPLCETDEVMISLDEYQGLEHIDEEKKQATVFAGTKLHLLGKLLFEYGLGMKNMGDIDEQSIAGAVSTGTHGTGMELGSLSTQVVGLTLITGTGDIVECSETENRELFKAAQVSLGMLGVISKVTLQCDPAYKLKLHVDKEPITSVFSNLERYNQDNRNFEFYWFPYTDYVQTKFSNITQEPAQDTGRMAYMTDMVLENGLFGVMSAATRVIPKFSNPLARFSAWAVSTSDKVNWSHKVYTMPRLVKFNEMEYNVPLDRFQEVFEEIRACIDREQFNVHFPLENRFSPADDIYLSSAYGRESAYISCHVYKGKPYQKYFKALENIFRKYDGRPHWAKLHTLTANELADIYPKWEEFRTIRQQCDPNGVFLNGYLRELVGVKATERVVY